MGCRCAFQGPEAPSKAEARRRLTDWLESIEAVLRDLKEAAGKYLIDFPTPGTPMAVLLLAHVMLRKYRIPELERRIEELENENSQLAASLACREEDEKP